MEYQNLLGPQLLAEALPAPHDVFGLVLHGTLLLSSRNCGALVSTGAPRTIIRPSFAKGIGFYSVPRYGDWAQRPDGSWYHAIEHYHPGLRVTVAGIHWRVRAVEADTGPFDLILGMDWLYAHRAIVDIASRTLSLDAPGGRMVLRFLGHPAILAIVDVIPHPPVAPVAHAAPPAPIVDLEEEPEEEMEEDDVGIAPHGIDEPVGNGFIVHGEDGAVTDDDSA